MTGSVGRRRDRSSYAISHSRSNRHRVGTAGQRDSDQRESNQPTIHHKGSSRHPDPTRARSGTTHSRSYGSGTRHMFHVKPNDAILDTDRRRRSEPGDDNASLGHRLIGVRPTRTSRRGSGYRRRRYPVSCQCSDRRSTRHSLGVERRSVDRFCNSASATGSIGRPPVCCRSAHNSASSVSERPAHVALEPDRPGQRFT